MLHNNAQRLVLNYIESRQGEETGIEASCDHDTDDYYEKNNDRVYKEIEWQVLLQYPACKGTTLWVHVPMGLWAIGDGFDGVEALEEKVRKLPAYAQADIEDISKRFCSGSLGAGVRIGSH